MYDASRVRGSECTSHLDSNLNRFTNLYASACEVLTQRFAFDQFAGNVLNRIIGSDLVNRQDVWVVKRSYSVRLLLKPLQPLRIASEVCGQEFQRRFSARGDIRSKIHFTHPAGADPFQDFVVANSLTNQQASLPVFNDPGSKRGDWGLDEIPRALM